MSNIIVTQVTTKGFINKEIVSYLSQGKPIKQKRKKKEGKKMKGFDPDTESQVHRTFWQW